MDQREEVDVNNGAGKESKSSKVAVLLRTSCIRCRDQGLLMHAALGVKASHQMDMYIYVRPTWDYKMKMSQSHTEDERQPSIVTVSDSDQSAMAIERDETYGSMNETTYLSVE